MKKQLEDVVYVAVVNILSSGKNAQKNYVERDLMLAKVSTAGTSKFLLLPQHHHRNVVHGPNLL
jgi:acetolactate synthase small subunit